MVLDNTAIPNTSEAEGRASLLYLLPFLLYCMAYPDGSTLDQYIDTQGMTLPSSSGENITVKEYPPMPVKPLTIFTELERKELKEIIHEVLDERRERYYRENEDDSWLYRGTY